MPIRIGLTLCAALAGALVALAGAASAGASTIAFQCGGSVCVVDPDVPGAKPRTVATGRLAGLTRDGKTVSWVSAAGGLVQASVGGGPQRTVFTGPVVNQPSMSPDGTRYMYSYPGPDAWGGLSATWTNLFTVGGAVEGVAYCGGCVTTHGWLNQTPIAAYPAKTYQNDPSSLVCRLGTAAESPPGFTGSCLQTLVRDPRGGIGFPSGNAAGTEIVAVLSVGQVTGVKGQIVRYSLATGAPIAAVTEGTVDTTPVFSPEGDRIAFERAGKIVVKDLAGGEERVIADGVYPFWGGTRPPVLRSTSLRYRSGGVAVKIRCAGSVKCRGTLSIKKGKIKLGSRAYVVAAGKTATVMVKPRKRGQRAIASARKHRVTVTLKPAGGEPVTKVLTLRR